MTQIPEWQQQGFNHIWLPYTQMQIAPMPLPVVGADGCKLKLADGRELIDGIASWWSVCHGYNHSHSRLAMHKQLDTLSHVMFAGLAHEQAYILASRLVKIAPKGLSRVFFADSGSVAVEVAMKMAVQYWRNKGAKNKNKFVAFHHSYHGDTMGAMSLSDMENSMHKVFNGHVPMQYILDIPLDEYAFSEMDELLKGVANNIAGLVIEPLVQGAGGMCFHSVDILAEIHRLCKKHNILFIADEIATGFGRTGSMFACDEAGISPDIMCIGKALTGGMVSLAATLATEEIFESFLSDKLETALMHGPTFMANPLACAAANASLDLFENEPRLHQVEAIETQLWQELEPLRELPKVQDVRVKGAIGVVEINATLEEIYRFRKMFVEKGVWLRPFGNVIYIMPPFVITPEELSKLTQAVKEVLHAW
jgi:adenosylmethionine-8-amino-7-oxononanoate aminotransferase